MSRTTRRIASLMGGVLLMIVAVSALVGASDFRPWGVNDLNVDRYRERMSDLDRQQSIESTWKSRPRPIAEYSSERFHFGLVEGGGSAVAEMEIFNKGDERLTIKRVRVPDGFRWNHHDAADDDGLISISPGGSFRVSVTAEAFADETPIGDDVPRALVVTDDPVNPRKELFLNYRVARPVRLSPRATFGATDPGEVTTTFWVGQRDDTGPGNPGCHDGAADLTC